MSRSQDPVGRADGTWVRHDLEIARLEQLMNRARAARIDYLILGDAANLRYLAGIGPLDSFRPTWLIASASGFASLVVARSEMSIVEPTTWLTDLREYVEWPDDHLSDDWATAIAETVPAERELVLGVEYGHLSVDWLERLRGALPQASFVNVDPLLLDLRMRKDPFELSIMREGGRIHAAQLDGVREMLSEGAPEFEISLAGRAAGARAAAAILGPDDDFLMSPMLDKPQTLGTGPRGAMVHARASTCRVRTGDVVQICFCGPAFFGYILGFDRPLVVGEPDADSRRILQVARDAHDAALERIRPGTPANVVHAAAADVLDRAGLLSFRGHRTGRGVGLGGQERPEIRESDVTVLEPGMTFTVEMGIYVPDVAGARFGDTVAVATDGFEMLTPASYEWSI